VCGQSRRKKKRKKERGGLSSEPIERAFLGDLCAAALRGVRFQAAFSARLSVFQARLTCASSSRSTRSAKATQRKATQGYARTNAPIPPSSTSSSSSSPTHFVCLCFPQHSSRSISHRHLGPARPAHNPIPQQYRLKAILPTAASASAQSHRPSLSQHTNSNNQQS
jgi:hypothetical protein